MSKSTKHEPAVHVSQQLHLAERAIDRAVNEAAELVSKMTTGRLRANLAAEVGQPALEHVMASLKRLGQARGAIVDAHGALLITQHQIGLDGGDDYNPYGGGTEKPSPPSGELAPRALPDAVPSPLRVVASA